MSRYMGRWLVLTVPGGVASHPCQPDPSEVTRVVGWLTEGLAPDLLPEAVWSFDAGPS